MIPAARTKASAGASASVPMNTGEQRDHLQKRIGLFARMCFATSSFFFFAAGAHRAVFAGNVVDRGTLIHVFVLALLFAAWRVAGGKKAIGTRALVLFDGGLVLALLTGQAIHVRVMDQIRYPHEVFVVLAMFVVLMMRAVVVPSSARTTLIVSSVGVMPALTLASAAGAASGRLVETASFVAIWCAAAIGLTTFASSVIYGLRKEVVNAKQLGQYVLERKLGAGGMGEVYLARHTMLRRPTAVKMLPPERAGADTVARFEREVRETSLLSHPNTVAIYDYGRTREGVFYYAMEYLDGLDLHRLVERSGPMVPSRVVHVLAQIAGALGEAHGRGLVHRDMKPANVMLCDRGGVKDTVKVLDFGLVKHVVSEGGGVHQTDVNTLIGTPLYMSPEAIRSTDLIDARSDIYAVGAIGYFLLTGKHVFAASSSMEVLAAHLHERPVRPSVRAGHELPGDLEAVILRCLEKNPNARYADAGALRKALLACDIDEWAPEDAPATRDLGECGVTCDEGLAATVTAA